MPLEPAPTQDITLNESNRFTQRWIAWFQKLINRINGQNVWAYYQDSLYTSGSPLVVAGGVRTLLTNNALGAVTTETFLSGYTSSLWSGNKVTPKQYGETYIIRLDITCVPSSSNQHLDVELQVAPGDVIFYDIRMLPKGGATPHQYEICIPVWAGQTFVANGGEIYITPSGNCSFYGIGVYISRISVP